jgi:hypothetical protein
LPGKSIYFAAARGNPASGLVGIAQTCTERIVKESGNVEFQMRSSVRGEIQNDMVMLGDDGGSGSRENLGKVVVVLMLCGRLQTHGDSLLIK